MKMEVTLYPYKGIYSRQKSLFTPPPKNSNPYFFPVFSCQKFVLYRVKLVFWESKIYLLQILMDLLVFLLIFWLKMHLWKKKSILVRYISIFHNSKKFYSGSKSLFLPSPWGGRGQRLYPFIHRLSMIYCSIVNLTKWLLHSDSSAQIYLICQFFESDTGFDMQVTIILSLRIDNCSLVNLIKWMPYSDSDLFS